MNNNNTVEWITLKTYDVKNNKYPDAPNKCGEILHENWIRKKSLAKGISNNSIDEMYNDSLKYGALGGKILGAGGRGYLMLICDRNSQKKVVKKFKKFEILDFTFDDLGSRKLY
mgnify:CR=1 FL=1